MAESFAVLNSFTKSLDMITPEMTEELRQNFLKIVDKSPDLYNAKDVERVITNDWTIRRFLYNYKTKPDLNKGLEALDKAMKWRKSFGVIDLNEVQFPQEFFCCAGALAYGRDVNDLPLLIFRGKVAIKMKAWLKISQMFLVNLIEKLDTDQKINVTGITLLVDFTDTGIKNVDKDYLRFIYSLFNEFYPGLVNATLLYKMPIVLETIYKLFRSWLCDEQKKYTHFLSQKNINQFVAPDQLPSFLMGTNNRPFRTVPENAPSAHELAEKLGISSEKTDKLVKQLQKFYRN